jgi:hypothetical protein
MWQVVRVTLIAALAALTFVHATGRSQAAQANVKSALQQTSAAARKAVRPATEPGQVLQLEFRSVLALAQPLLRGSVEHRRGGSRVASPPVALRSAGHSPLSRWLDLRGSRSSLAVPVSEEVSLGLRYSFQRSEDVEFRAAKAGALDDGYANHKLMVSAQWRF